jgi:hypothetical protein
MAVKARAIEVMLSSRVDDPESTLPDGTTLREVRERLTSDLAATLFTDDELFSIFVNEGSAALDAEHGIEQQCRRLVDQADIVLVLYNGSAGWAAQGLEGICETELRVALDRAPQKVRIIALPIVKSRRQVDKAFQTFVDQQTLWTSQVADTYDRIREESQRALRDAVAEMVHARARMGSRRFASGRGEALQWRRLDFRERAQVMRDTTARAFVDTRPGRDLGDLAAGRLVEIEYERLGLLLRIDAVPAAMTVAAAREMVGQPFLRDHRLAPYVSDDIAGPVHVIACLAAVTEPQAVRQLGFPDALIVPGDFGVYAADEVHKMQVILLANCINSGSINNAVQNLLSWLESSAEGDRLVRRAEGRRKIVELLADLAA